MYECARSTASRASIIERSTQYAVNDELNQFSVVVVVDVSEHKQLTRSAQFTAAAHCMHHGRNIQPTACDR